MKTDDLIQRFLDGQATPEEAHTLSDLLKTDVSVRGRYLDFAELHAALLADEMLRAPRPVAAEVKAASPLWLRWRPVTAAAAGVAIGVCSASLAFAFGVPRAEVTAMRLPGLRDGSFETQQAALPRGFPSSYGRWSGDEAEPANAKPGDGLQSLRFVRATGDPALPNSPAHSCDVYQLVDLRVLQTGRRAGEATLEMSAQFLDARTAPGAPVSFSCRLYVFSGLPESLREEWPLTRKEALASGSGMAQSKGGAPQAWHTVTAKVLLPAQADFAVVQLVAGKTQAGAEQPAEFGEQFADDVRLTLKTQPTLPVRPAQQ
jgi:hypothetical protein